MAEKLVPVTTRLPEALRRKIRTKAAQEGVKMEQLIQRLLEAGLKAA